MTKSAVRDDCGRKHPQPFCTCALCVKAATGNRTQAQIAMKLLLRVNGPPKKAGAATTPVYAEPFEYAAARLMRGRGLIVLFAPGKIPEGPYRVTDKGRYEADRIRRHGLAKKTGVPPCPEEE